MTVVHCNWVSGKSPKRTLTRPSMRILDIIDFYGPCDEDPLGKDQVHEQRIENQHRWANDYED